MEQVVTSIIISIFTFIHILESLVNPTRIASMKVNKIATGYSYSGVINTTTRFFMMVLMPSIGYLVDKKIDQSMYLFIVHTSLLIAGTSTLLIYTNSNNLSEEISRNYSNKKEYLIVLLKFKFRIFNKVAIKNTNIKLFAQSAIVYSIYSTSIFVSFFLAIIFYEFRVTLSLLSGVTNGFATIILNFLIEPYLASQIDRKSESTFNDFNSILLGRTFGTLVISQLIISILWLI